MSDRDVRTTVEEYSLRIADLESELADTRKTHEAILDDIWGLVYPGKKDWEYPGMVYRHVKAELEDRKKAADEAKNPS